MPKRTTRTARQRTSMRLENLSNPMLIGIGAQIRPHSFQINDVVLSAQNRKHVGKVCVVSTPGIDYLVCFTGVDYCVPMTHPSLELAPVGTQGPDCPAGCC